MQRFLRISVVARPSPQFDANAVTAHHAAPCLNVELSGDVVPREERGTADINLVGLGQSCIKLAICATLGVRTEIPVNQTIVSVRWIVAV